MDRPVKGRAAKHRPQESRVKSFLRRYGFRIAFGLLGLLLIHDIFGSHGFLAMRRAKQEVEAERQRIEALEEENKRIGEDVHSLKTDPAAIERIAREEMGLARPGEKVFRLPPPPEEKTADTPKPKD
jgi:cell division protein FtsB